MKFINGLLTGCITTTAAFIFKDYFSKEEENISVDNEKKVRLQQILAHGEPIGGIIVRKLENHVLGYDCKRRVPLWVSEHLTKENLKGDADRKNANFKSDPEIPEMFTAQLSDYRRSGWSRGHMSPAGDNKNSQDAMQETFYLSNIVPQDVKNNGGFWNRLEIYCRDMVERYSDVWVTSGPLYLSKIDEDGKKYVKYQVIGENEVAVPTHLYKVVVAKDDTKTAVGSFIVPNEPIDYSHHLTEYQVSQEYLEKQLGIKLHSTIKLDTVSDLCKVDGCELMNEMEMNQYIYIKRLKRANDEKFLKVYKEMKDRGIHITDEMHNLYNDRVQKINDKLSDKSNINLNPEIKKKHFDKNGNEVVSNKRVEINIAS